MEELFRRGFDAPISTKLFIKRQNLLRPLINNQIRAGRVRVIDETGKQLGVIDTREALQMARERNLDLIQVTEKVDPPVCKIMDRGKYLYQQKKKEKPAIKGAGELKGIRLGFKISEHDLETKAILAEKFLKKGNKVRIEMVLRGREKALAEFSKEKLNQFFEILEKRVPTKIERDLKREARGFTLIVSKE